MIRVRKPATPPAILERKGDPKRQAHRDAYDADPASYRSGTKMFDHDGAIYNAKSVKKALIKAQHSKCCYCEGKVTPGSFGDVEHFRPKAGYQQEKGDSLGRPGYYWLAYEWTNLFLSCQICNQQLKKNLFPVKDDGRRARSHHDDLAPEEPLLIDPGLMDPSLYIAFRAEIPYAIGGNAIGGTTIRTFGLDERPALIEDRRTLHASLVLLKKNRDMLAEEIADGEAPQEYVVQLVKLDKHLAGCILDSAEYAAMARAALNVAK